MLRLYRRHRSACGHTSESYRRCSCPIYVEGTLGYESIRRSLDLTSWQAASDLIAKWNAAGEIDSTEREAPLLAEAVATFLADAKSRHLSPETIRKYEHFLERRFLGWCQAEGYTRLKQLRVEEVRTFRNSWSDGALYAAKNLERLRSFFRFALEAGWIKANPALQVKPPKGTHKPTLPFTAGETKKILDACGRYRGNQDRIRAFVLVMRHAGLRIGDTIALKREHVEKSRIFLYQAKTGTPVYVPVLDTVVEALAKLEGDGEYFFWTGQNLRSAVANWERYLASLFKLAGVTGAHSHRFRDTFSVSLLEAGVPIEDVSILLGHSSVAITNRHYAPFVKSRRERLEERVRQSWAAAGQATT